MLRAVFPTRCERRCVLCRHSPAMRNNLTSCAIFRRKIVHDVYSLYLALPFMLLLPFRQRKRGTSFTQGVALGWAITPTRSPEGRQLQQPRATPWVRRLPPQGRLKGDNCNSPGQRPGLGKRYRLYLTSCAIFRRKIVHDVCTNETSPAAPVASLFRVQALLDSPFSVFRAPPRSQLPVQQQMAAVLQCERHECHNYDRFCL